MLPALNATGGGGSGSAGPRPSLGRPTSLSHLHRSVVAETPSPPRSPEVGPDHVAMDDSMMRPGSRERRKAALNTNLKPIPISRRQDLLRKVQDIVDRNKLIVDFEATMPQVVPAPSSRLNVRLTSITVRCRIGPYRNQCHSSHRFRSQHHSHSRRHPRHCSAVERSD